MLIITNGTDSLELKPGTSIGIEKNSPIYFGDRDPNFIPGTVTYSIDVPNTPHNRILLGRPGQLDNPNRFLTEEGWRIIHEGHIHADGRLEVRGAGLEVDIRITFVGGIGGRLSALKEGNLGRFMEGEDITLGDEAIDLYNYAIQTLDNPAEYNFLFPTINLAEDSGYQPENEEENAPEVATRYAFLNLYDSGRYAKATSIRYSASSVVQPTIEYSAMAAQPRVLWVLKKVLAAAGFTLTGVFDSDPHASELRDLLLITNATQDVTVGVVSDEPTLNDVAPEPIIRPRRIMPNLSAADLLKKVANRFCWTPFIDEQFGRVRLLANRDLLHDPSYIDLSDKVDPRYVNERPEYDIPTAFTSPIAADDAFAEEFTFAVAEDARITIYQTYTELRESDDLPAPNDLSQVFYVVDLNEYCFYRGGNASRRIFQSLGKDLGYINRYQKPVYESGAATLLMRTGFSQGTHRWLTGGVNWWWPAWWRDPVTPLVPDAQVTKECILLFYRGLQPNGEGRMYPFASAGRYNFNRETLGQLSMLWNGVGGLYEVWWKDWVTALNLFKPVTFRVFLSSGDIARIDMSRKYRIGGHLYFIRRLRTSLLDRGVGETTLELMKVT